MKISNENMRDYFTVSYLKREKEIEYRNKIENLYCTLFCFFAKFLMQDETCFKQGRARTHIQTKEVSSPHGNVGGGSYVKLEHNSPFGY